MVGYLHEPREDAASDMPRITKLYAPVRSSTVKYIFINKKYIYVFKHDAFLNA
jgi:hypothetical protein